MLDILGPLDFHRKFNKEASWDFDRDFLISIDQSGRWESKVEILSS